jgi:protein-disulfide isomerase
MRINSNTLSNIAFTAACITIVVLGALQIRDRMAAPSAAPTAPSRPAPAPPVTDVSAANLSIAGAPVQGNAAAKIVLVEFSDYQCPFCARYSASTYDEVQREFVASGKVRYAFVNFPLANHEDAHLAAQAGECAHAQGRFWPLHELLFTKQNALTPKDLVGHAKQAGLDVQAFSACLAGARKAAVDEDISLGRRMAVDSTPTFLVGVMNPDGTVRIKKKILGAQPLPVFRQALNEVASQ